MEPSGGVGVGDMVNMLINTHPSKLLGKIKMAICNHHAGRQTFYILWPGI